MLSVVAAKSELLTSVSFWKIKKKISFARTIIFLAWDVFYMYV